jgi:hypothetical protein
MAKTTTTTLTYVNFANTIKVPLDQPPTIFVTWTSVTTDDAPNVPQIISTNTYSLVAESDISNECALVQAFWTAVFVTPQPPFPIITSE